MLLSFGQTWVQVDAAAEPGELLLQRMPQETSCSRWELGMTNPGRFRKRLRGLLLGVTVSREMMLLGMAVGPSQAFVAGSAPTRSTGHSWSCPGQDLCCVYHAQAGQHERDHQCQ